MADDTAPQYAPPSSDAYMQQVMNGEQTGPVEDGAAGRSYVLDGNDISGYYGVDPEYRQYANETEKPLRSEEGPQKYFEDMARGELDVSNDSDEDGGSESSNDSKGNKEESKSVSPDATPSKGPTLGGSSPSPTAPSSSTSVAPSSKSK